MKAKRVPHPYLNHAAGGLRSIETVLFDNNERKWNVPAAVILVTSMLWFRRTVTVPDV